MGRWVRDQDYWWLATGSTTGAYGAPLVTNRHNLKTVKSLKPKNQNQQPNYVTTHYEMVHIIYRLLPSK